MDKEALRNARKLWVWSLIVQVGAAVVAISLMEVDRTSHNVPGWLVLIVAAVMIVSGLLYVVMMFIVAEKVGKSGIYWALGPMFFPLIGPLIAFMLMYGQVRDALSPSSE